MLHEKTIKSALNKHKKRDNWFLDEYSVNPYEGCSCNCLYCYIRGSKYGEQMDDSLAVKSNVLEVLEKQLQVKARKKEYGIVAVGSATDAYIHHEEKYKITEGILKLLLKYRFPVFISTKSRLILRDIELLKEIDRNAILPADLTGKLEHGVILSVSISSMDTRITDILEPGAATPKERLEVLRKLKEEGFLTGVNAIPVLPYISDNEIELSKIISEAANHGAEYVLTGELTLFGDGVADSKTLYYKFLNRYDPSLLPKYNDLYKANFYPPYAYQQQLRSLSSELCTRYGIRDQIIKHEEV